MRHIILSIRRTLCYVLSLTDHRPTRELARRGIYAADILLEARQ